MSEGRTQKRHSTIAARVGGAIMIAIATLLPKSLS
jgi:hypothetical protein